MNASFSDENLERSKIYKASIMSRPAFTLIELLVVVTIICILVAILLPVLRMVRESAHRVRCLSNLGQVGKAVAGYAADNHGAVIWSAFPHPTNSSWDGDDWTTRIRPYVELEATVSNVSEIKTGGVTWGCSKWYGRQYIAGNQQIVAGTSTGYGLNGYLYHDDQISPTTWLHSRWSPADVVDPARITFRLARITYPTNRLLIADSNDWGSNGTDMTNPAERVDSAWTSQGKRHGDRSQAVFCDLHAQAMPLNKVLISLNDPSRF